MKNTIPPMIAVRLHVSGFQNPNRMIIIPMMTITNTTGVANNGTHKNIIFEPKITGNNGKYILKTSNMLNFLINNQKTFKKGDIASFSQKYL